MTNKAVPVPIGEWFKLEIFWHHSPLVDGRVWVAINDETIFDHNGSNKTSYNINRIFISPVYGGGPYPLYHWLDDLEIWAEP